MPTATAPSPPATGSADHQRRTAPRHLPAASLIENLAFNSLVIVPNVLQGLFRRRPHAVLAATKMDVDRWAVALLGRIRRGKGPDPVWVRVVRERALLVSSRDDVRRVLEGSPHPFAPDPQAKRKGMSHFQPDAVTLSRGELWQNRRRFNEAVLETGEHHHRFADRFAAVAGAETQSLLAASGRELDWEGWYGAFRRITRRIVLGDAARHDEHVTDLLAKLMDEANRLPSGRSDRFEPFMARLAGYVEAAEAGSLVALFEEAPSDSRTEAVGQLPHWLFAMGDTLAINAFRALALLASHPKQRAQAVDEMAAGGDLGYLEACLQEAMRLWLTTPLLGRETLEDTDWSGAAVPPGTPVLISNTFNHRDRARHDFADRFAPEAWTQGDARDDWAFNHFSRGPQGCPGAALALFVGSHVLATVLAARQPRLVEPKLDPTRPLPHMLDFFRIRLELAPRRQMAHEPAGRSG